MYANVEELGGQQMDALSPAKRPRGRPPKTSSYANNLASMSSSNGLSKRPKPWLQGDMYDAWSPTREERNQIQGAMDILAARNISVVPVTNPMTPTNAASAAAAAAAGAAARAHMAPPVPANNPKQSPELEPDHDPDMDFAHMFCEVIVGQSDPQSVHAEQLAATQRMMLSSPPRILDKCYKCDLCPRSYSSRAGLWYHKKAHSGDKQYSCSLCYKRFSQKSHMEVHLNYHRNKGHGSPSDDGEATGDAPEQQALEGGAVLSMVRGPRSDDEEDADGDGMDADGNADACVDRDSRPVTEPDGGGAEPNKVKGVKPAATAKAPAERKDGDVESRPQASPTRAEQRAGADYTERPSRPDEGQTSRALSQMQFAQMFCESVYQDGGNEAGDAAQQAIRHGSARFNDLIISAIPPAGAAEPRALQPAQVHALINKSPKLDKCYRCELCSNTYSSRAGLWYHRKTHAGSKQYTCRICRQSFTQKGHLQSHMRTHLGDRPYPCGQCDATFTDAASLENHLYTHSSEKPFACRHCNERFSRQPQLIQHERMHAVNKPLKCTQCDRSFALKNNLINHMRVHRSS